MSGLWLLVFNLTTIEKFINRNAFFEKIKIWLNIANIAISLFFNLNKPC
jgi:hypothetical protein